MFRISLVNRRIIYSVMAVSIFVILTVFFCDILHGQQANIPVSSPTTTANIKLTLLEQAFLKKHPIITVAFDRSVPPIEFKDDDGDNIGLSIDYLRELTKKLGVKFDIKNFPNRSKSLDAVQTGKVDMFAAVLRDDREKNIIYTKPYLSLPIAIYTQAGEPYIHDLADLQGKTVAVLTGSNYVDAIRNKYPSLQIVSLFNAEEALQKLTSGEIYAFMGDMLSTGWTITTEGYTDIQISGDTNYNLEVCMATRKNLSILRDILQKGLDEIKLQDSQHMQSRWMKIEYKSRTDRSTLWILLGLCVCMTLLFVIWNHRLRKEATQRQKITDELREGEEYFQSIFDTMHSGVMLVDPKTFHIEQVNDYACQLIGLPREKILGQVCNDFVCPAERGHCPVAAMGGTMDLTERSLIDCKGRLIPILKAVVRIKHKGKDMFLETFTDMTEVKKAEVQIQADEDKYRSLFEMSRDATIVSRNMHIIECNDAAIAMFGYANKEEMLKLGPLDLSAPLQADGQSSESLVRELAEEASAGSLPLMEWQFIRKDGIAFTGEIMLSPAIVDGIPAVQGNIRDVSVRKAIEMERMIFQQALVNAPVSVVITDGEANIEYVNPFFTQTTGYQLYEVLGKNPKMLQSGKTKKEVFDDLWSTVREGKTWCGYFYNTKKDGQEFHEYARVTPIMDSNGKIIHYLAVKEDVTETEKLKKEIEYLAKFPSDNPNPVFRTSADGILLYVNDAGRKLMELWQIEEGQSIPEDYKQVIRQVFETKTAAQISMLVGEKCYSVTFAPVKDENYVNAYAQDISELKKVSIERDRLFNNSADMLCIASFDGYFKQVNPAWTKILGWTEQELTHKPWLDFIHPDDIETTKLHIEKLLQGEPVYGFENRYICKDGSYRWFSWNSFALPAESLIFAVVRDVTENKKARELLNESQQRLSLAIDGAGLGLWDWNIKTNANFVNAQWAAILGYSKDDIIPTFADTANFLHPEDRERMQELLNDHLTGKTDYYRCRFRMKTKSGEYKWILSVGRIMQRDEKGTPLRMLGIHQDIDEQIKMENELILAKKTAEEANQAKSLFLANMSHEIRTPMNAILGYTQLMQRDAGLSDVQHKYLEIVNHSGTHLLSLINDILEMSKIEAGRSRVNSVIFDFLAMLEDIEMMFHVRTTAQNVQLRTIVKGEIPKYIRSDESKVRQILINLLGNAVKFTSSGHINITVNCELQNSETPESPARNIHFKVEVEDTGCGIAHDDMPKIFEAFEQSRTALERGGTGLGLPISREYARMLNGDITAKSEPGLGSTFTFIFTAQYVEEAEQAALAASITYVTGLAKGRDSASVLVVDDKESNRSVLVELLGRVGFFVRHAENGRDALDIVKEWQPNVILMDRRMPIMDGYEALRKIKDLPQGKKIPILIVTASALEENRADALGYGADGFIRKPYDETEIFDAIRRVTGIEYLYEKDGSTNTVGSYKPTHQELAELPEKIMSDMKRALHDGDMEYMQFLIGQVSEQNRNLGNYLMAMAEHYEYEKLQKLLNATE